MSEAQHFGPVQALVDHDSMSITLTLNRGAMPLGDAAIQNLVDWARSVMSADYLDYELVDLTREEAGEHGR